MKTFIKIMIIEKKLKNNLVTFLFLALERFSSLYKNKILKFINFLKKYYFGIKQMTLLKQKYTMDFHQKTFSANYKLSLKVIFLFWSAKHLNLEL